MRDVNDQSITDEVIARLGQSRSARVQQISEALVRHLHALVREIEPTQEEWSAAIDFLTRTGHMCDDKRQEFILLSDTLGVSMLVDSISHRMPSGATETMVLGPFYVRDPKEYPLGSDISEGIRGMPMLITGSVSDAQGRPLTGAVVDVWQSDSDGYYDVQHLDTLALRGRLRTDEQGKFWCWSIRSSAYPIPSDGPDARGAGTSPLPTCPRPFHDPQRRFRAPGDSRLRPGR
jgi:hydroxyquinol 1,2-dioxygenase